VEAGDGCPGSPLCGTRLHLFRLIPKPVDFSFRPNEEVTAAFVLASCLQL